MARSERLLDLIQLLRRRRFPVSGAILASELGISLRSLYRDIATLKGQGVPIEGEAGFGYVLGRGYLLPPLMFTVDEIDALALGAHLVAERGDLALSEAALDALAKIRAVLPSQLSDVTGAAYLLAGPHTTQDSERAALGLLREAIKGQRKVRFAYQDKNDAASSRIVWPFAVGFFREVEVLLAWCELREDFRHFRTDRILDCLLLEDRYPASRLALLKRWQESEFGR